MARASGIADSLRISATKVRKRAIAQIVASAELPSDFGQFRLHVFENDRDGAEHVAIVRGDVVGVERVPTRLHSECLTGDVLASRRCDCRAQLELALRRLGQESAGVVLYMRQEGRGIGLTNKIRAYQLQERGFDTVDANLALGFAADERDYSVASAMLRTLGVSSVALMTNNPDKVQKLRAEGIDVTRVAHEIQANEQNLHYLETKAKRSGHLLDLLAQGPTRDQRPEAGRGHR